ncbi:ATP-binding protein [Kitasatospora sp. NPDC093550]|uniref:ATP-binding protein n=1 Tax=Kitasatospora sp. NPDC093550 TaxID=3364089 RepID=UPI00382468A3
MTVARSHGKPAETVPHGASRIRTRRLAVKASGTREQRAQAAHRARHKVAEIATGWGLPEPVLGSLEILASEIISNATMHAGGRILVGIHLSPGGDAVAIEVRDPSQNIPHGHTGDVLAESGRGLLLVQALADRWGIARVPGGKRVWAQLEVRPPVNVASPSRVARRAAVLADVIACGRLRAVGGGRALATVA